MFFSFVAGKSNPRTLGASPAVSKMYIPVSRRHWKKCGQVFEAKLLLWILRNVLVEFSQWTMQNAITRHTNQEEEQAPRRRFQAEQEEFTSLIAMPESLKFLSEKNKEKKKKEISWSNFQNIMVSLFHLYIEKFLSFVFVPHSFYCLFFVFMLFIYTNKNLFWKSKFFFFFYRTWLSWRKNLSTLSVFQRVELLSHFFNFVFIQNRRKQYFYFNWAFFSGHYFLLTFYVKWLMKIFFFCSGKKSFVFVKHFSFYKK